MKRVALALVLAFSFLGIACNKEEVIKEDNNRIIFNSSLIDYSKAVTTFGPLTLTSLQNSADGFAVSTSGIGFEMNNLVVKYGSGKWGYTGNYFWPLNPNQNVRFTAYAPAGTTGITMTSSGIAVSGFSPATLPSNQIDLIYAAPANFNRAGSGTGGVSLTFNHLLTQIIFSVTTLVPGVTLTSIQLTVPSPVGAYNGTTWSNSGSTVTYTIPVNSSVGSTAVLTIPVLMVPKASIPTGTIATANFSILGIGIRSVPKDLSVLTSIKSWQAGYKVTYNSILGLTRSGIPEIKTSATEEYRFN